MQQDSGLLGSLERLTGAIAGQALAVAKIRTDSALRRADSELALIDQDFIGKIDRFEVTPDNFEEAFADHRAKLEEYADGFDYAPARTTIKNAALANLAKLKAQAGVAINKQQLARTRADFDATLANIYDLGLPAAEAKERAEGLIAKYRESGGIDPLALDQASREAESRFQYGSLLEKARATGSTTGALEYLGRKDNPDLAATPASMRQAAAVAFQKELDEKSTASTKSYTAYLRQAGDFLFPDVKKEVEAIRGQDISESEKEAQLGMLQKHQDDALYSYFQSAYAEARVGPAAQGKLEALLGELEGEGDWKVADPELERWVGPEQEERRKKIMDAIRLDLQRIQDQADKKDKDAEGDEASRAKSEFWTKYRAWQDGVEVGGRAVNVLEVYTMGLQAVKKYGDTVLSEVKQAVDGLDDFVAPGAREGFKALANDLAKERTKGKIPASDLNWVENQARDIMLAAPGESFDYYQKAFSKLQATLLSKEYDAIKGERMKQGLGGQIKGLADIGVMVESGALGTVINSDPRTQEDEPMPSAKTRLMQAQAIYTQWATEYGISGTPHIETEGPNDGRTIIETKDGKAYTFWFDPKTGEPVGLFEVRPDGSRGAEVKKPEAPKPAGTPKTAPAGEAAPPLEAQKAESVNQFVSEIAGIVDQKKRAKRMFDLVSSGMIDWKDFEAAGYKRDGSKK